MEFINELKKWNLIYLWKNNSWFSWQCSHCDILKHFNHQEIVLFSVHNSEGVDTNWMNWAQKGIHQITANTMKLYDLKRDGKQNTRSDSITKNLNFEVDHKGTLKFSKSQALISPSQSVIETYGWVKQKGTITIILCCLDSNNINARSTPLLDSNQRNFIKFMVTADYRLTVPYWFIP